MSGRLHLSESTLRGYWAEVTRNVFEHFQRTAPGDLEHALGLGPGDLLETGPSRSRPGRRRHRSAPTADGARPHALTDGHAGSQAFAARKSSISAAVGAVAGPRRVTLMAPPALARRRLDPGRPAARQATSTPVWVSPAPLVSTAVCG